MIDVLNPIFDVPKPKFEKVSLLKRYQHYHEFGGNFRDFRMAAFPQLKDFAPVAHLTCAAIGKIESGKVIPPSLTVARLKSYATLFGCGLHIPHPEEFDDGYLVSGILQFGIVPLFYK